MKEIGKGSSVAIAIKGYGKNVMYANLRLKSMRIDSIPGIVQSETYDQHEDDRDVSSGGHGGEHHGEREQESAMGNASI